MKTPHIPVLLDEVLSIFKDVNGSIFDCTLGYAGHSSALLQAHPDSRLIACDKDDEALSFSTKRLEPFKAQTKLLKGPYSEIFSSLNSDELANLGGILADIGVSSLQLDKDERGFCLNSSALDMRMDTSSAQSAKQLLASISRADLEQILKEYGELKNYKSLADKILSARAIAPITSAKQLADIVGRANIKGRSVSVATLVFQAIRIAINDELTQLQGLLNSIELFARKGKISSCVVAIISFHSLEDRIVKESFKSWAKECICPANALRCECGKNHSLGQILTKKPLVASASELAFNPRASSAKLRAFRIKDA